MSTSSDYIETQSVSAHEYVRAAAAYHHDTRPTLLAKLAADPSAIVRHAVARNPNTPASTVRTLCHDSDTDVALAAADTGRMNSLRRHATTLPEPARSHALLLVNDGFPGWESDLDRILNTATAHDRPMSEVSGTITIMTCQHIPSTQDAP